MTVPHSVRETIGEAVQCLAHSSDSPELDAELLLCHVLGKTRAYLYAWPEHELSEAAQQQYRELITRRETGFPLAYLTGSREFWGLQLEVNPDVLIPRPETELLVQSVLEKVAAREAKIADLGTGSGAIAIALASARPQWHIVALDNSVRALKTASRNAQRHGLEIEFIKSDWCDKLADQNFDVIVANPPYIEPGDKHLQGDIRFEPARALVAQENGMADIRKIIDQAGTRLRSAGWLMLEHGFQQGQDCRQLLSESGFCRVETCLDLSGMERVTMAQFSGMQGLSTNE